MGVNIINNFPPGSAGSGGYVSPVPEFTYSGQYQMLDDGNGDWRIKFLTSGVLTFTDAGEYLVDIFLVGGGGDGYYAAGTYTNWGGGGGGCTCTEIAQVLTGGTEYTVTVGAAMGATSFGPYSVPGGQKAGAPQVIYAGGNGGSGGSSSTNNYYPSVAGGRDGANGSGSSAGRGQGTTTREFAEPDGELYSNGGGVYGSNVPTAYTKTNMGHGGHGCNTQALTRGQPGVVILRNRRRAAA